MNNEIWKDIHGFPGYQASSLGRIGSMDCILRPSIHHKTGRAQVVVGSRTDRTRKSIYVHKLVLLAFQGPCPDGKESRHLDGNKLNNQADNLCWDTPEANDADLIVHGTHRDIHVGELNGHSILTEQDVQAIRREYAQGGILQRELAAKYNVCQVNISAIVTRKSWRHVT